MGVFCENARARRLQVTSRGPPEAPRLRPGAHLGPTWGHRGGPSSPARFVVVAQRRHQGIFR
eukprot:2368454-Pyramimonas_sp.AAC.1